MLSVTRICLIALTLMSSSPCLTLPFADKDKTREDAMDLSNI